MRSAYVPHRQRLDQLSRAAKAKKIMAVLGQYTDLASCQVLDVGTSAGYIAQEFGKRAKSVTSVDIFDERKVKTGYKFVRVKDARLPFPANSFDLVISNHVIEHIPDQLLHMDEIHRVLKRGGLAYLATPNKHWIIETHYKLPFLSFLPRSLGELYVQKTRKRSWNVYPLSYQKILKLAGDKFRVENKVPDIIKNPADFKLDLNSKLLPIAKIIPKSVLGAISRVLPTHIVMLRKV